MGLEWTAKSGVQRVARFSGLDKEIVRQFFPAGCNTSVTDTIFTHTLSRVRCELLAGCNHYFDLFCLFTNLILKMMVDLAYNLQIKCLFFFLTLTLVLLLYTTLTLRPLLVLNL
uniref:(northern house mosquito) hypothetical protein n=1 Tax=Culex pipiens TaxID=7175 RepID=A0A8D7ZW72_CULPI